MSSPDVGDSVIRSQLDSLDDTDCYSTAWEEALANTSNLVVRWGGRGQGGRGTSRRTFQPKDVVVDDVRLEYVGNETAGSAKLMLDGAVLKLLSGRVYGLIGNNGCGTFRSFHGLSVAHKFQPRNTEKAATMVFARLILFYVLLPPSFSTCNHKANRPCSKGSMRARFLDSHRTFQPTLFHRRLLHSRWILRI